jgi:hypothetical protein
MLSFPASLAAQGNHGVAGDYAGMLGPYHVKLHVHPAADGSLTATVDSPDANMFGMQCTNFLMSGPAFSFNVPMVQGTWSGVVSVDGSSLTGFWTQGTQGPQAQPHALSLTRGVGATNTADPPAALVQQPVPVQQAQQSATQCPPTSVANYWDGASWKPLRTPEALTTERGFSVHEAMKNPFNNMRGNTYIMKYKGTDSATVVASDTRFCFTVGTNSTAQYLLGTLDVKDGHREIEYTQSNRGSEGWLPAKRQRPINSQRASDTMILITPAEPLPPGQYIVGTSFLQVYDFTVLQ